MTRAIIGKGRTGSGWSQVAGRSRNLSRSRLRSPSWAAECATEEMNWKSVPKKLARANGTGAGDEKKRLVVLVGSIVRWLQAAGLSFKRARNFGAIVVGRATRPGPRDEKTKSTFSRPTNRPSGQRNEIEKKRRGKQENEKQTKNESERNCIYLVGHGSVIGA